MYIDLKNGLRMLNAGTLMTWLYDAQTHDALTLIHDTNKNFDRSNQPDKMWRYSRSINPGFFMGFQQTKCLVLMARMADILVNSGLVTVTEYSDPRKIWALKDKPEITKAAAEFGKEFMDAYNALAGSSTSAGPISRAVNKGKNSNTRGIRRILVPTNTNPRPTVNVTEGPAPAAVPNLDDMVG
nr:MAG: nucleocapsid protein [Dichorhavirus sp. 'monocotyledonae']